MYRHAFVLAGAGVATLDEGDAFAQGVTNYKASCFDAGAFSSPMG